jgi:hypothetical protein
VSRLLSESRGWLRLSQFAYVDSWGGEYLPLFDKTNVRNAIAVYNQTTFESVAVQERARRKIVAAARRFGVEIHPGDNITRRVKSLRAASLRAASTVRRSRTDSQTQSERRPQRVRPASF